MYIAPLSPLGWLSVVLFVVCLVRAIVGSLRLDKEIKKSGAWNRFLAPGSSWYVYPFVRSKVQSGNADRMYLVLLIDIAVAIAACIYMNGALSELPPR